MRSTVTSGLPIVVFVCLFGVSSSDAVADVNHWSGFSSTVFTQGFVRTNCPGQIPCQDDDFDLIGSSSADCPIDPSGSIWACISQTQSYISWELQGYAGHLPGPDGDVIVAAFATLSGERVDADLFVVDGYISGFSYAPTGVEVAVFQYSGDPAVFDGLEVERIQDVVDLGIINSDDVLAVDTFNIDDTIDMQVQVTGLADDEIIVFAAGDGRIPPLVPATTAVGAALLLLAMLVAGTWALRRRKVRAG